MASSASGGTFRRSDGLDWGSLDPLEIVLSRATSTSVHGQRGVPRQEQ